MSATAEAWLTIPPRAAVMLGGVGWSRGCDALEDAAGQTLALSDDYLNPRDRLGFATDLLLDVGLYAFALGAYDRLEAGVVELDWSRDGAPWTPVPTSALVAAGDVVAVPEPSTAALLAAGLLALAWLGRRRRSSRN